MILKVLVDDQLYSLNVPDKLLPSGEDVFSQMDRDMDRGWQMSREWVEHPDRLQRCQIVADKLLTALEEENHRLGRMMAGYILSRLPDVDVIDVDVQGEMQNTRIAFRKDIEPPPPIQLPTDDTASAPDDPALCAQADREVSKVFKVGKQYRFSVLDQATAEWRDSPAISDMRTAENLRQQAFRQRLAELSGKG